MKTLLYKLRPYLLMAALGVAIYLLGVHNGKGEIQRQWNNANEQVSKEQSKLRNSYNELERKYSYEVGRLSNQLVSAKKEYQDSIDTLNSEYAIRLQQSSQRAEVYKHQANSGATECRDLASHAARLDTSIEDGRRVVNELKATVRLRDNQIKSLAAQIRADHQLLK